MSRSKFITQETTKTMVDSLGRTIEVTESKIIKANANAEPFFMFQSITWVRVPESHSLASRL